MGKLFSALPTAEEPVWQTQLRTLLERYVSDPRPLFDYLACSERVGVIEYNDGDVIFHKGDTPDAFAIVSEGEVDILGGSGNRFKGRGEGELIGEQAFLLASQPGDQAVRRSASVRAHGTVKLITFHGDVIAEMNVEARARWFELMAHILNQKLVEASDDRSRMIDEHIAKSRLLERFCDKESLSLVRAAIDGRLVQSPERDAVVWFSDIAGFSAWAKGKAPKDIAQGMKTLMSLQADLIHAHGGCVDKFMGDGLMGFWFIDKIRPESVVEGLKCAMSIVEAFDVAVSGTDMAELSLRIGLHCGDVCFGDFGTDERIAVTLIGESVNLAARCEQLRASDQNPGLGVVRVSEQLRDRIAIFDPGLADRLNGPQKATVKTDGFSVYWMEMN